MMHLTRFDCPFGPVAEPLGQSAIRLMPEQEPGGLDQGITNQAVAGLGDALAAPSIAAVIGAGGKADIACDLAPVGEPPASFLRTSIPEIVSQSPVDRSTDFG